MPSARCSAVMRMALIATSQSASASVMLGRRCWISRVMEHVDSFGFDSVSASERASNGSQPVVSSSGTSASLTFPGVPSDNSKASNGNTA